MLTVTWRLKPIIVTTHLLLGLTTLSLLWWLVLGLTRVKRGPRFVGGLAEIDLPGPRVRMARRLAVFGLIALVVQIVLGGWTSSNYAALACPDLPTCQDAWWPPTDFQSGFSPARDVALNDGRGFGSLALVAIQLTHRIGALVLSLMLLFAGIAALRAHAAARPAWPPAACIAAWCLQLTLGISMVLLGFPLALATAHNAAAALLLLAILALNPRPPSRRIMNRTDAPTLHSGATWRDYLELTKPRVVALIVFTAVIGTLLAAPGLPPLDALVFGNLGISLAAASAAAINHVLDRAHRCADGAHPHRPLPTGHLTLTQALRFALRAGRGLDGHAGGFRQRADGAADLRLADRLRGRLHGLAQARDAAEHRHRRRRRRRAAGAGLGRGHQSRQTRTRCCCS